MSGLRGPRVALVHDWLITWGGAESVLHSLAQLFPEAPIYTSLWNPVPRVRETFGHRDIRTTWLQSIPGAGRNHRKLLPLMPGAFRRLDLSHFDLVISDSHAFSKAVRVRSDANHVCYCHTPPRYLWDMQEEYLGPGSRILLQPAIEWLRGKDLAAAGGVSSFLANSNFVAERIRRVYGRPAKVLYPPVNVDRFSASIPSQGEYFLAGGRLVPYKRIELAIKASNRLGFPLRVFGGGPELRKLIRIAGPRVEFLGWLEPDELAREVAQCKAFLFPGIEDFGILPVEVMAVGKPVIAPKKGGAEETVIHGKTGFLYEDHSLRGLEGAISAFQELRFDPSEIRAQAARFDNEIFRRSLEGTLRELDRSKGSEEPGRSRNQLNMSDKYVRVD